MGQQSSSVTMTDVLPDDHVRATYNEVHEVGAVTLRANTELSDLNTVQLIGNASKKIAAEFAPDLMVAIGAECSLYRDNTVAVLISLFPIGGG